MFKTITASLAALLLLACSGDDLPDETSNTRTPTPRLDEAPAAAPAEPTEAPTEEPTAAEPEIDEKSLEYKLAAIEGQTTEPSADDVMLFGALLDRLEDKCGNERTTLGDYIVAMQNLLRGPGMTSACCTSGIKSNSLSQTG